MEVNNVFYESTAIGHHYRSKKSLALAYLMTIGSKALVLTEVNANGSSDGTEIGVTTSSSKDSTLSQAQSQPGNSSPSNSTTISNSDSSKSNGAQQAAMKQATTITITSSQPVSAVQKSFDDEAAIQRKILHEEPVQQFQRALDDKPGVSVLKKGRNGEFRHIYIRVKDDPKRGCKAVVWHSRLGSKKSFALDPAMSVNVNKQSPAPRPSISGSDSNSNSPQRSQHNNSSHSNQDDRSSTAHSNHPASFQASVPVLTLANNQRKLVIQFMTASECNVCLHLLQALGVKDPNIAAVTGSVSSSQ